MQVDLRVADDLRTPSRCVLTAITVQGDAGLDLLFPVPPDAVTRAITRCLADPPGIAAVKIGLLADVRTVEATAEALTPALEKGVPVVVDPVMRSTHGSDLSDDTTAAAFLRTMAPATTVITPNRQELDRLAALSGQHGGGEAEKVAALVSRGIRAVLVTGGDDAGDKCTDILYPKGGRASRFQHPRIGGSTPRGTGCALSTALAIHLARGMTLEKAVESSIEYVTGKIRSSTLVGNQRLLFPGAAR